MNNINLIENSRAVGVYAIRCVSNGKTYIGSTINSFWERRRQHFNMLNENRHYNSNMQASWNKHGAKSFTFGVIETCEKEFVRDREQWFIDSLSPEFNSAKTVAYNPIKPHLGLQRLCDRMIKEIVLILVSCNALDSFLDYTKNGAPVRMFFGFPAPRGISPEVREKMSRSKIGIKINVGVPKSESHKKAQSEARLKYVKRMKDSGLWPPAFYAN